MPWPKPFLDLTVRHRRFINNFMMSRIKNVSVDTINWNDDCIMYNFKNLYGHYYKICNLYKKYGPLPED